MNIGGKDFVSASQYDDPTGVVIGAFVQQAALFYQGRQQSQSFYAKTDDELLQMARELKAALIAENPLIYRQDDWELRIYN